MNKNGLFLIMLVCLSFTAINVHAQADQLAQAHMYADTKDYDKAIEIYKKLYDQTPNDVYPDYLNVLLASGKNKDAEKVVNNQLGYQPRSPLLHIDLGRVYEAMDKGKKADEEYSNAIQLLNGDDIITQQVATAFGNIGKDDYVLQTFERARQLLGNTGIYNSSIAKLYAKKGEVDKAIDILLESSPGQYINLENTKALLLELVGNDQKKLQQAQKALIKRINTQPENPYYAELLTWIYTQKNDWDGALIQIEALDERNKENGHRLMDFARTAANAHQYETAVKAYNEVIDKGKDQPYYQLAQSERLSTALQQLKSNITYTPQDVTNLEKQYSDFFNEFPKYYATETARDYALLEAQYNNSPRKGIDILQKAIGQPEARKDFIGRCKLQLGDYLLLTNQIWDASLTYSQVDKDFKEDALGEEARFRNAKLAYYRGDFAWAQRQLTVLKASTSELIANDALDLSVLITENIPADSNYVPLRRFAYADLLLFQNKDKEAETLLDSISTAFPKHPLADDILLLRAQIAEKHRNYTQALAYLKQIYEQYGQDVLGDDAVFKTADIYENYLHQPGQAKHFYEQLIIDYPGSTFVQTARQRLNLINNPALP